MNKITRRQFLQQTASVGLLAFGLEGLSLTKCPEAKGDSKPKNPQVSPTPKTPPKRSEKGLHRDRLVVAEGKDARALTFAAIAALGGMEKIVNPGDVVVVKPNIGWDRQPEQAANTNPQVVAALVEMCLKAGAGKVKVFDRTCNEMHRCYENSGIARAAKEAGAEVKFVLKNDFVKVKIPNGKVLKIWSVYKDMLTADKVINVPIAKHHSSATLTMGMKNLMGIVGGNRGLWHLNLHHYIADCNTFAKIDLTVLDAFRILTDHGPSGGRLEDVKLVGQIIAGTDRVAVDSYGATLFNLKPEDIKYIQYAYDLGVGEMDLKKIKIERVGV